MKIKLSIERILTIATWVLLLGTWYTVTEWGLVNTVLIPSPLKVIQTFGQIIQKGYNNMPLLRHLGSSFERLFSAFALVIITAIPLGLLSGYFSKVRAIIDSIVEFYRPLPPLAYYTLLVLWLGIDNTSKITLLYLAGFAPVYIACVSAVTKINRDYVLAAQTLGASQRQIFLRVVLPACAPEIFVGLRTAIGVEYTTLVAAEMVAASSGIGWMVLDASNFLKSDTMVVGIIIMGLTGVLIDWVLRTTERKFIFWKAQI